MHPGRRLAGTRAPRSRKVPGGARKRANFQGACSVTRAQHARLQFMKSWSHRSVSRMSYICKADQHHQPAETVTDASVNLPSLNPAEPRCRPSAHRRLQFYLRKDSERVQSVSGEEWGALSVQWGIRYPFTVFATPRGTVNLTGVVSKCSGSRGRGLHREGSEGPGSPGQPALRH